MAKKHTSIALKDHKEKFEIKLPYRLINLTKSEMDTVSKKILDRVNNILGVATGVNQWKSTGDVINRMIKPN